jgi:hypothetical protein
MKIKKICFTCKYWTNWADAKNIGTCKKHTACATKMTEKCDDWEGIK